MRTRLFQDEVMSVDQYTGELLCIGNLSSVAITNGIFYLLVAFRAASRECVDAKKQTGLFGFVDV